MALNKRCRIPPHLTYLITYLPLSVYHTFFIHLFSLPRASFPLNVCPFLSPPLSCPISALLAASSFLPSHDRSSPPRWSLTRPRRSERNLNPKANPAVTYLPREWRDNGAEPRPRRGGCSRPCTSPPGRRVEADAGDDHRRPGRCLELCTLFSSAQRSGHFEVRLF